jgi:DNA-binding transcriptional ArsR family regulator
MHIVDGAQHTSNASATMNSTDSGVAASAALVHRALASPIRADMLRLIAEQTQSVTDLARASGMSVSMASRHLATLAASGLIVRERNGSWVEHRLTAAGAAALQTWSAGDTRGASSLPADARQPDASDLTGLPEDDVGFVLHHGLGAFAIGICDRESWIERLVQDLGHEWRARLPTLWEAAMRLYRGEPIGELPLPPGLVAAPPTPPELRPHIRACIPLREDP